MDGAKRCFVFTECMTSTTVRRKGDVMARRRRKGRRDRVRVLGAASAVAVFGVVQGAQLPSALAATCDGTSHRYAGQYSIPAVYYGIERFISSSSPGPYLGLPSSEFVAHWIGLNDPVTVCPIGSGSVPDDVPEACWVQAGQDRGIDPYGTVQYYGPYFEYNTQLGYYYQHYASVSLGTYNTFYTVYWDGAVDSKGRGEYYAAMNNGGGTMGLGRGWLPAFANDIQAMAEAHASFYSGCPSIGSDPTAKVYFGASASGQYGSSFALFNEGYGFGWSEWTDPVGTAADYPYSYHSIHANSSFSTWGGTDHP